MTARFVAGLLPSSSSRRGWVCCTVAAGLLALAGCSGGGGSGAADSAALTAALVSGDASAVSLPTAQAAVSAQIQDQIDRYLVTRTQLYGVAADGSALPDSLSGIDWNPSHDSSTFTVLDTARNAVMVAGNWRYVDSTAGSGQVLAVTGQMPAGSVGAGARYAAFGGNPLAVPGNAAMDALMRNVIGWLTAGKSHGAGLRVVTAHLPGKSTYWFPHEPKVRSWLATQYPGLTLNGLSAAAATSASAVDDSCDGDRLDACLQNADLLVIGRQQGPNVGNSSTPDVYPAGYDGTTISLALDRAQARGLPVLYLHHYRDANDLASRMLNRFGLSVSSNYWAQEGLKGASAADLPTLPAGVAELQALVGRLELGGFSTRWSGCVNDLGRVRCEASGVGPGDAAFISEFLTPAVALRARLRALDALGLALFATPGYELEKRLVLLGDKYRESVSYPMSKETAGPGFFRAYFSDMTAYINRASTTVARNLGSFSDVFAAGTPTLSRRISAAAPTTGQREVMTGLYVMPGRSVTLTRLDSSAAAVTVGLNLLRDTTHVYNTYDRPTMLASPRVTLAAGGTLTLTSPFGGPLFVFIGADPAAAAIEVQVEGVITHPVLRNAADPAQVAAFEAELASTPTSWVGVSSDALTVHSHLNQFRQTLANYGNDLPRLVAEIDRYMVHDTYELAGFWSSSGALSLAPAVTAFCLSAGWDCSGAQHRRDVMQHVIVDDWANCGAGCSGNPYDQSWALDPLGWGETHEIGHNLQRARLNIYGGLSTEVSNNLFPIHKQIVANRALARATPLRRGGNGTHAAFDQIRTALASADPAGAMRAAIWTDPSYGANGAVRLVFYRQLIEFARHYNPAFSDGWELVPLLYLLERNFSAAVAAPANWTTVAAGLGFGQYATAPAAMDGNDFVLIAGSRIIGRDLRPVFDLWGIAVSAEAAAQVAAYGLSAAELLMFPMADVDADGAGIGSPVPMSATAVWPAGF
jgi:immunomodulating metalloprotease